MTSLFDYADVYLVVLAAVFGLLFGSFGNVLIYRIPAGKSVVSPGSACGSCGHPVRSYDNIPVISWLVLGAKCRDCKAPISWRYPLIESLAGVLFALIMWGTLQADTPDWYALPGLFYFGFISLVLSIIDIDTKRLPNVLTMSMAGILLVLFMAAAFMHGDFGDTAIRIVSGAALCAGILLFLAFIKPGGMGMGDVKLALSMGIVLGYRSWASIGIGFFAAFILGSLLSVLLIAFTPMTRKNVIPFGPWLVAGTWIGYIWGDQLFAWYLQLVGLA